jgi:pilus assembly protein CpaB
MKISVKRTMVVLLVVALIVGFLAVWMSSRYIDGRVASIRQDLENQYELTPVVVASRDLEQGDRINRNTVTLRRIPLKFAPEGAIAPNEVRSVEGMAFRIPIPRGQTILPGYLTSDIREAQRGFADVIQDGMRALTFPVDIMSGVGGLLNPGDRIDLMATVSGVDEQGLITLPLLQNLLILAVGEGYTGPNNTRYQHITLELSPRDSARVLQARQEFALTAVLRSSQDGGGDGFDGVMTLANLFPDRYSEYFNPRKPEREAPSPMANFPVMPPMPAFPPPTEPLKDIELIIGGSGK